MEVDAGDAAGMVAGGSDGVALRALCLVLTMVGGMLEKELRWSSKGK